jgi:hypothetical protein
MFVNAIESALGFYLKYGFVLLPKQEGREQSYVLRNIQGDRTTGKLDFLP